jgi:hypothetical protein
MFEEISVPQDGNQWWIFDTVCLFKREEFVKQLNNSKHLQLSALAFKF